MLLALRAFPLGVVRFIFLNRSYHHEQRQQH
jgi:hypothetical protein